MQGGERWQIGGDRTPKNTYQSAYQILVKPFDFDKDALPARASTWEEQYQTPTIPIWFSKANGWV
ncbi:hypothetical protein [Trichothermofontia sp.]